MKDLQELFGRARFDVEHALDLYASSFFTLPAEFIYEKDRLSEFQDVISRSHIYIIGFTPRIDFDGAEQKGKDLHLNFLVAGELVSLKTELPDDVNLKVDDGFYYLENNRSVGRRFWWNEFEMQKAINSHGKRIDFKVKYIGQAYGKNGERNAIDRLLKHETLQKISLKGIPDGYKLTLLLLEVHPSNRLISFFNPFAEEQDDGSRVKAGLKKIYGTSEAERTSLYEAALIRYFSPEYNKEFKKNFPSTNLKLLQDCYEKDFSAVIAQVCIDELPFTLSSEAVAPNSLHISKHALHKTEDRDVFFCMNK